MTVNRLSAPPEVYLYQGCILESDFVLHALSRSQSWPATWPIICIRSGQPEVTRKIASSEQWIVQEGCFAFDMPGVGRFVVVNGCNVYLDLLANGDMGAAEQVLLGTAFAIAMMQRQQFCLHAAVLARDGRTIAFCGDSGEGKSTLAMTLANAGWEVLTDDLALVRVVDRGALIENNGRHLRLWRESLEAMGRSVDGLARISPSEEKYYVRAPRQASSNSVSLDAICILASASSEAQYVLEPLSGMPALAQLRRHTYRQEFLSLLGCDSAHLQHSTALMATVPIYRFQRPRSLARLAGVVPFLESAVFVQNHSI